MKRNHIITMIGAAALAVITIGSCSDVLDETPRSSFTLDYFKSEDGIKGGLTQMYSHLRYIYGGYYYGVTECGTDEYTWGLGDGSGDANFMDADYSGVGSVTPSGSHAGDIWNELFININTANGVIENGEAANMDASLIAEAYFFRAFDYFLLVQNFGGVPLDFGSGEMKANTSPSRVSIRNTVPEVYTKGIFPSLTKAVEDLPENPRVIGAVTKTVARLYLAKAYLTYAWWLENPNDIPTYPLCDRTDPDGKTAAQYFQLAYDVAMDAIENPGPYALQETFYDICTHTNDRNSEMLLWADHTATSWRFTGAANSGAASSYSEVTPPNNNYFWLANVQYEKLSSVLKREDNQGYGRPWRRMAPTQGVFTETFADPKDSRFDGTFQTVYRANWNKGDDTVSVKKNANDMNVKPGDPVLSYLLKAVDGTEYVFKQSESVKDKKTGETVYPYKCDPSGLGLGVAPGRADYVVDPLHITRWSFPGPYKISGVTQESDPKELGQANAANIRPNYIAKFSELYLVAAEAAVKGAKGDMSARDLVNVLRARAGKWKFSVAENAAVSYDYSADLVAATPSTIDVEYILAERSREYFGEGYRRMDLIRTQMWNKIAGSFFICEGKTGSSGTAKSVDELISNLTSHEVKRDIKPYMYLLPIPQGQIDGLEMSDEEKAAYQNPGY
ncbi:MAG: RagB/SusD family nutrient uptake outer membrane protein [Salinivirgaceae bacterium]|nr:RagB/SusD family nutrient uptake outer membrane protein [Salinivirgaceae bacterium]